MATMDALCTGLVSYLGAHAGLNALITARIYPHALPEARALPAVTYQIVATPRDHYSAGVVNHPYILFKCWSYTHTLSWQVAGQLCLALEAYHGMLGTVHGFCSVEDPHDGRYEPLPAPGIYPVLVYARVTFRE